MQQNITPINKPIDTRITLPGSKEMTHRAILLAALADGVSDLSNIAIDIDTRALISGLKQLGIAVQLDAPDRSCIIAGGGGRFPRNQATIDCANSTLTAQYLLAACAATPGVYHFSCDSALEAASFLPLLQLLQQMGAQFIPSDAAHLPLSIVGAEQFQGSDVTIDTSLDTNSISALLIATIRAHNTTSFFVPDEIPIDELNMTTSIMGHFGLLAHGVSDQLISIPAPQLATACDLMIEPDFALATYFFAAAAITGGNMSLETTNPAESCQSDIKILKILQKMGCTLTYKENVLRISGPQTLSGVDISLPEFTAIFATIAATAPFASRPTRISHTGLIKPSETVLLKIMHDNLMQMGIATSIGDDWIEISTGNPKPIAVKTNNNVYAAMAFSLIGLKTPGTIINHADCIESTFPAFFTHWDQLGKTLQHST